MTQLLLHLWGDYILQSDWMATNKTRNHWAAAVHAGCYTLRLNYERGKSYSGCSGAIPGGVK